MSKQTQTQKIEQAQTQQQTAVADRLNLQPSVIASAVTTELLTARAIAKDVIKALNREAEAKGAASAGVISIIYALRDKPYILKLGVPDKASKADLDARTDALNQFAADAGFKDFASSTAKERTWVDPRAAKTINIVRQVFPVALQFINAKVEPVRTSKGLLKVPGRFLLTEEERKLPDYKDDLDSLVTIDESTHKFDGGARVRKSLERMKAISAQDNKLQVSLQSNRAPKSDTKAAVFTFSEEGARQASDFLGKYLANRTAVGATVARETKDALQHLFANLGTFLGAISEDGKHIVPAVADVVLTQAAK